MHVHCHFLYAIMQSRSAAFLHGRRLHLVLSMHLEEYIIHEKTASVLLIGHYKLLGFFVLSSYVYVTMYTQHTLSMGI